MGAECRKAPMSAAGDSGQPTGRPGSTPWMKRLRKAGSIGVALGGVLLAVEFASFGPLASLSLPSLAVASVYAFEALTWAIGVSLAWRRGGWVRVVGICIHLLAGLFAFSTWWVFHASD